MQEKGEAFVEWLARRVRMPKRTTNFQKRPLLPSLGRDDDEGQSEEDVVERRTKYQNDKRVGASAREKGVMKVKLPVKKKQKIVSVSSTEDEQQLPRGMTELGMQQDFRCVSRKHICVETCGCICSVCNV